LAINQPPAQFKYARGSHKKTAEAGAIHDHKDAFTYILDAFLADPDVPDVSSKDDIHYACHRTVQGGDFEDDQLIDKSTFEKIEKLSDLAPL
jgi:acetate kinase